jgi:hypothetical protein
MTGMTAAQKSIGTQRTIELFESLNGCAAAPGARESDDHNEVEGTDALDPIALAI